MIISIDLHICLDMFKESCDLYMVYAHVILIANLGNK